MSAPAETGAALTPARLRYLLAIADGTCGKARLAREMGVSRPSASKAVGSLAAAGLVRDAPGRAGIALTPAGSRTARWVQGLRDALAHALRVQGVGDPCARTLATDAACVWCARSVAGGVGRQARATGPAAPGGHGTGAGHAPGPR